MSSDEQPSAEAPGYRRLGLGSFLDPGDLAPVMQMEVKWNLAAADGKSMRSQLWLTLNKLDGAFAAGTN